MTQVAGKGRGDFREGEDEHHSSIEDLQNLKQSQEHFEEEDMNIYFDK